jgi:tyrosyl-tRNA synthetase
MPAHGLEPQIVLTVPLLVGLDGVEKMAKSANNAIGITESPHEMFGKLMSISDDLMWTYYELLTDVSLKDIQQLQSAVKKGSKHPKKVKIELAKKIVADFHSEKSAAAAAEEFERRFARKELPMDAPEQTVTFDVNRPRLSSLMVDLGFVPSSSSATRVIDQGGVKIDGERILDKWYEFDSSSRSFILQVGKKARRVTLKPKNGD